MDFMTLRLIYEQFFKLKRVCSCTEEVAYPQSIEANGERAVCGAHLWLEKRDMYQKIYEGLVKRRPPSLGIARGWAHEREKNNAWLDRRKVTEAVLQQNPFKIGPIQEEMPLRGTGLDVIKMAFCGAHEVFRERTNNRGEKVTHRGEHPVFIATKSDLINLMYEDSNNWKDALFRAPIVVIADNSDRRAELSEIISPCYSREYGIVLVYKS